MRMFNQSAALLAMAGLGLIGSSAVYADPLLSNNTGSSSIYLSAEGGGNWLQEQYWATTDATNAVVYGADSTYNFGWNGDLAIGAKYDSWRVEFAAGYIRNNMKSLSYNTTLNTAGNRISAITYLVNAYYDVDTGQAWFPYFKAGLGAATFNVKGASGVSKTNTRPAGDVGIGVGFKPNQNFMITLGYEKLMASRVPLNTDITVTVNSEPTTETKTLYSTYQNNLINLGITFFIPV